MSSFNFLILIICNVLIAFGIAKYQQKNGYKFTNSFIGALIGVFGLSMLIVKMIIEL
jgi:hypothetical protein